MNTPLWFIKYTSYTLIKDEDVMINLTSVYWTVHLQGHSRKRYVCGQSVFTALIVGVITCMLSGCGWLLEGPPPYPDQGVGGSEMMNGRTGADEVNMDASPNDREQSSLDPVTEEE